MAAANLTRAVLGGARKMRTRIYLFEREKKERNIITALLFTVHGAQLRKKANLAPGTEN